MHSASPAPGWLARKLAKKFHKFVLRRLPLWNRPGRPFHVQFRPDFETGSGRFPGATALLDAWVHGMEENNWGDLSRLYFLHENVTRLEREAVPGDFAELGVYKGCSAKVLHLLAPERRIWLFDTFAGFADSTRGAAGVDDQCVGQGNLQRIVGGGGANLGHRARGRQSARRGLVT